MAKKSCIHVGTVTRPHGIKGECCVDLYADSPELLKGKFFLYNPSQGLLADGSLPSQQTMTPIDKATVRMHKGRPLLTLPHIKDRTQAEALRGTRIYIMRDTLPPLHEDEAYIHDILGMTVVNAADETIIGILENVTFSPAHMIWIIRSVKGANDEGKEILFPAVEEFIDSFDMSAGIIRISPPSGLLEIYLT